MRPESPSDFSYLAREFGLIWQSERPHLAYPPASFGDRFGLIWRIRRTHLAYCLGSFYL